MLAYYAATGQHHILYEDGEDEVLHLHKEDVRWRCKQKGWPTASGLPAGEW